MKRVFYFFIMAIFAISCEGPMGPPGPPGPQGPQGPVAGGEPDAYWATVDFPIDRWDLDESGDYFYATFTVDALTENIYKNGIVVAYIETNGTYKTMLPYTRYCKEPSDIPGEYYLWSEVIDFTYTKGSMTFYANPSDFFTDIEPAPIKIRAIFIW